MRAISLKQSTSVRSWGSSPSPSICRNELPCKLSTSSLAHSAPEVCCSSCPIPVTSSWPRGGSRGGMFSAAVHSAS